MRRANGTIRTTLKNSCVAIRTIRRHIARFLPTVRRSNMRRWPGNGALPFPFDPTRSIDEQPALWLPELHPGTVVLGPALTGQKGIDARQLVTAHGLVADHVCETMRYLALRSPLGTVRVAMPRDASMTSLIAMIPIDCHLALRYRALARLKAHVDGIAPPANIGGDIPSSYQRYRLNLLLRILDIMAAPGTSARDVAMQAIYPGQNLGRATEWKGSSQRRHTFRLIREARDMMTTGYRALLTNSS